MFVGRRNELALLSEEFASPRASLDEFPYLTDADPALPSIVQKLWDSGAPRTVSLKLLLCGSMISQMQELLAERNPLYGRKTLALDLGPLPLRDAVQFVPRHTSEGKLVTCGVFGGVPFYLQLMDSKLRVRGLAASNCSAPR